MPVYGEPIHGVTYSEAYKEAMAVAPVERAMLVTLELLHPGLTAPIRLVLDHQDLPATLEQGAPANGGEDVTFTALPLGIQLPEESDQAAAGGVRIWIDGVSATVAAELDGLVETLDPVQMIVRLYASDDASGPANLPPLVLELREVELDESRITATAAYSDPANLEFPGKSYTRAEHPGLGR